MQAMHGSLVWLRRCRRATGVCTALALMLSAALLAPTASAAEKPPTKTYLALGDSLAFGYTQQIFEENLPNEAPSFFEANYPNAFARKLRASKTENNKGLVVVNDGCPGETTDSFIGNGPLGKAVDPTPEGACPYHFAKGLPLHNDLATLSQLEDALEVLNPCFIKGKVCPPAHEIKAVTLNIGANDELKFISKCEDEVKTEVEEFLKEKEEVEKGEKAKIEKPPSKYTALGPEGYNKVCQLEHVKVTYEHIDARLETILGLIRSPGYGNYAGSIVLIGAYNPLEFVITGSDTTAKIVNQEMGKTGAKFGAKFADMLPVFNPPPLGNPIEERNIGCTAALAAMKTEENEAKCKKAQVGLLTEMGNEKDAAANQKAAEEEAAKELGEGKKFVYPYDGSGDIHPTPAGATKMGAVIFANYP